MKKPHLTAAAIAAIASQPLAAAVFLDDFQSGDLSNYTATVILDANGGGSNTASWQSTGGTLQYVTTGYDGIEQSAYIYNGLTLGIGEELQVSLSHTGASQDLGLYVGGTAPTAGVRQDYVSIYARGNGQVFSRGFDGTSEFALTGGGTPTYDTLFIARTAANTYELGYYDGATRSIVTTRTPGTANDAEFVGFYTDVRGTGTLGNLDNLTVIPEPGVALLGGLGLLGLLRRRRA